MRPTTFAGVGSFKGSRAVKGGFGLFAEYEVGRDSTPVE
jgi:hypothetical protein